MKIFFALRLKIITHTNKYWHYLVGEGFPFFLIPPFTYFG